MIIKYTKPAGRTSFLAMKRVLIFLLGGSFLTAAQDPAKLRDALEWTVAQRGRMAQMTNPVVRVHGTASLAALVCAEDRGEGSSLFRDAITGLHGLSSGVFTEKGTTVLPAASFTGLWKYVVPAALQCDPALAEAAANQRSRERIEAERRGANATLRRSWDLVDPDQPLVDKQDNNDRAAQIAQAALDAADPETFDVSLLVQILFQLRERAPDLADDLFLRALELVKSLPASVNELAQFPLADADGSPDAIEALIDTTLGLLKAPVNNDSATTLSLALQLLPSARELAPEKAAELEAGIANLQGQFPPQPAGRSLTSSAANDHWLAGRIQSALAGSHIEQAREYLSRIHDSDTRAQLAAIIGFAEAGRAIEARNDLAMPLADILREGVKRSLLYAGIIGAAQRPDAALQVLPLAIRDITPLPAEHRIRLLSAVCAALVGSDVQATVSTLDLLVKAYNDVYTSPRRGRFEPRASRRTTNDSMVILAGTRGLYEAVQTGTGRRHFGLKVPGVTALSIGNFVMSAAAVDPARLEAQILGLRDENTRAGALVRLADIRIRTAKAR